MPRRLKMQVLRNKFFSVTLRLDLYSEFAAAHIWPKAVRDHEQRLSLFPLKNMNKKNHMVQTLIDCFKNFETAFKGDSPLPKRRMRSNRDRRASYSEIDSGGYKAREVAMRHLS